MYIHIWRSEHVLSARHPTGSTWCTNRRGSYINGACLSALVIACWNMFRKLNTSSMNMHIQKYTYNGTKATYTGSSVHNVHIVGVWICFTNCLQHLLILQTACTETRKRLAATTDWSLHANNRKRKRRGKANNTKVSSATNIYLVVCAKIYQQSQYNKKAIK